MNDIIVAEQGDSWQFLIDNWVEAKHRITNSEITRSAYVRTIGQFRDALHKNGMEFNSDKRAIRLFAQKWANAPTRPGKKRLSASSFNRRLSIVSSFYDYVVDAELITTNPVKTIDRAKIEEYADAMPLDSETLKRQLLSIDTSYLLGKRDLALLLVAIMTGRRVSEIRYLDIGDITNMGDSYMVTWRHVKGGKILHDLLEPFVKRMLEIYLQEQHGSEWRYLPHDTPVWVSLSTHGYGERLSIWGIAGIYKRRLGISKVHASRYTFASLMESLGASLSDIQRRLGHASPQTTAHYLRKTASAKNPQGKEMGKLLGFGDEI